MVDFFSSDREAIFSCGLLISHEQESEAILLSQQFAKENNVRFTLSTTKRPPFIRLYEFALPQKNVSRVFEETEILARDMVRFHIQWGETEYADTFAAVWVETNEPLSLLHDAVLVTLNPLREGFVKAKYHDEKELRLLSDEEKQSIHDFGSPWARPFIPHMILAKARTSFAIRTDITWPYKRDYVRGMVFGTKEEDGEFITFKQILFAE